MASAPGRTAASDAGRVGDAADLHERPARDVGRIVGRATGRDERPGRRGRVRRAHERLADERGVEPEGAPARDGRRVAHARLGDDEAVVGDERAQAVGPLGIDLERAQVAVVEADEPGIGRERRLELALVVGLDQRLQPELEARARRAGRGAPAGGGRRAAGRRRRRRRAGSGAGARRPRTPWPGPAR